MSTPEDSGSANGTPPTKRDAYTSVQTGWGRFFELAGVVLLMASLISLVLLSQGSTHWLLMLFSVAGVVGAIASYYLAVHQARKQANTEKLAQAKFTYQVTANRLLTLKTLGVPVDVRRALTHFLNKSAEPEDKFLKNVAQDLSWERINQWRAQILTHTRTDTSP